MDPTLAAAALLLLAKGRSDSVAQTDKQSGPPHFDPSAGTIHSLLDTHEVDIVSIEKGLIGGVIGSTIGKIAAVAGTLEGTVGSTWGRAIGGDTFTEGLGSVPLLGFASSTGEVAARESAKALGFESEGAIWTFKLAGAVGGAEFALGFGTLGILPIAIIGAITATILEIFGVGKRTQADAENDNSTLSAQVLNGITKQYATDPGFPSDEVRQRAAQNFTDGVMYKFNLNLFHAWKYAHSSSDVRDGYDDGAFVGMPKVPHFGDHPFTNEMVPRPHRYIEEYLIPSVSERWEYSEHTLIQIPYMPPLNILSTYMVDKPFIQVFDIGQRFGNVISYVRHMTGTRRAFSTDNSWGHTGIDEKHFTGSVNDNGILTVPMGNIPYFNWKDYVK